MITINFTFSDEQIKNMLDEGILNAKSALYQYFFAQLYPHRYDKAEKDGFCFKSEEKIAEYFGVSTRTLREVLKEAEKKNLFVRDGRNGFHGRRWIACKSLVYETKNYGTVTNENDATYIKNTYKKGYKRTQYTKQEISNLVDSFEENIFENEVSEVKEQVIGE